MPYWKLASLMLLCRDFQLCRANSEVLRCWNPRRFKPFLHLGHQLGQWHRHAVLFRVVLLQPHLLDLDYTVTLLVFAEDNGPWDTI